MELIKRESVQVKTELIIANTQTASASSFSFPVFYPDFFPMPLNLRSAIVSKSYCCTKTLPLVSPSTFVYLFLSAFFLSGFLIFG